MVALGAGSEGPVDSGAETAMLCDLTVFCSVSCRVSPAPLLPTFAMRFTDTAPPPSNGHVPRLVWLLAPSTFRHVPASGTSASSLLSLLVASSNQMPGALIRVDLPSFKASSPCWPLDGDRWGPGCAAKGAAINSRGGRYFWQSFGRRDSSTISPLFIVEVPHSFGASSPRWTLEGGSGEVQLRGVEVAQWPL